MAAPRKTTARTPSTPDLEVWQNSGYSTISLNKFDSRGNIIREQISAKRRVMLTPEERRLNQEVAATDELDFFQNGMLVPVRLIDSEEDTEKLQANPNAMSETAMKALFQSQPPAFKARVEEINNPTTLNHLLEVANEVDATIRQVGVIQDKLHRVVPQVTEVAGTQILGGGAAIGTKAPEGERPSVHKGKDIFTGNPVSPK